MNIGLQIPSFKYPGGTGAIQPKLKEIVTTADKAGFYSLWVMDHYYQIKGLFGEAYSDPMLEAYTTRGYFAGLTEKAYLGVMVTGVINRHPSVLLKMVNTLDILSGGRAYLGIGAAWYEEEAKGFGIPYPSTSGRFELLEDNLQLPAQTAQYLAVGSRDINGFVDGSIVVSALEPDLAARRLEQPEHGPGRR